MFIGWGFKGISLYRCIQGTIGIEAGPRSIGKYYGDKYRGILWVLGDTRIYSG
jgi:hypothetical protein